MASPNPRTKWGSTLKKKGYKESGSFTRTQTGSGAHYVDLKTELYKADRPPNRSDTPKSKALKKK